MPPPSRRGGGSRPTIGDVAALAQVSKATVSFVINDRPGVSPQARQRVLDAIDQLGWQPNAGARALSTKRSQTLGLVMRRPPELLSTDPFFTQFVAGIETGLAPLDCASRTRSGGYHRKQGCAWQLRQTTTAVA
ncbi:LacI family DNA-binding transcriptional regulator [Streptomyces hygroscopicus]|uniref:LacI family DNA-binding transcriptional regulator n=1 Tax=Streptomyces hygroscopicus TaxID=1912 RepID=UPI00340A9E29